MLFVIRRGNKGPAPATGVHAELLAEMSQTAGGLLKLIEFERAGTYDGNGIWFLGGV